MPNHIYARIAFGNTAKSINTIVGKGKRFMDYELVQLLEEQVHTEVLNQMQQWVNETDQKSNKQHEVFEPSFDRKECRTMAFMKQKIDYMHLNPCKHEHLTCKQPEDYVHSLASCYITVKQGIYPVITYMELQDIDLASKR